MAPPRVRPLPLNFHNRRSRIDRARQLSMNVELQRSILYTTELYNLESERERLKVALQTSLGPPLARVVHNAQSSEHGRDVVMHTKQEANRHAQRRTVEERLAKMTSRVAELEFVGIGSGSIGTQSWVDSVCADLALLTGEGKYDPGPICPLSRIDCS